MIKLSIVIQWLKKIKKLGQNLNKKFFKPIITVEKTVTKLNKCTEETKKITFKTTI